MSDGAEHQFGEFGGRYVPEPLIGPLEQLTAAFEDIVPTRGSSGSSGRSSSSTPVGRHRCTTPRT